LPFTVRETAAMSALLEFPIKGLFPGWLAATFRAQGQNRADLAAFVPWNWN
jgi:hypothetical protein